MSVRIVLGAQFGDEAKGKIADFMSASARYVVRSAGGPNTGHTIVLPEGPVVLHQLACGVLRHGVTGISGPGMVIQPFKLEEELQGLEKRGLLRGEVVLSDRAHVILPLHEIEDVWEDELRGRHRPAASLGTTRSGIGPAYADRAGRFGIRLAELSRPAVLRERLELLYATKTHLTGLPPIDEVLGRLVEVGGRLAAYIRPTEQLLWDAVARGESVLLEGAQSALLDLDFGTYPYVTSSHPTSAGALLGSGIPPTELDDVVGVAKAYSTRVGAGPFPTEDTGERGEFLRRVGGERGATTGRPRRCGWLDLVLLRYAARLNGFTSLAITKVDVLGGLERIPVCVRYQMPDGSTVHDALPTSADDLGRAEPVYEQLPGWPEFHERLKERIRREGATALPSDLRRYLDFIEQETGVAVEYVGYGAHRDETVWLGPPSARPRPASMTAWSG
ncbi:MAG: adenylosuccinate synthase [Thermoplasmata archaeon]|nr:adenylosuccinate synthase [Thermoplasmata archaeon]